MAAVFAILVSASLLIAMPSASAPLRVETLALEPTLGTIPPAWTHHLYFPMVAGDSEATE